MLKILIKERLRLIPLGVIFIITSLLGAEDRYVVPATIMEEGIRLGFSVKGYSENVAGHRHQEAAFKAEFSWIPRANFGIYFAPLLRHHYSGVDSLSYSINQLGDTDIGMKLLLEMELDYRAF